MKIKEVFMVTAGAGLLILGGYIGTHAENRERDKVELINVSYDATRELYENYNQMFSDYWENTTGKKVDIIQSHGGSGKQARSVIEGNEADIVTLALEADVKAIEQAGLIKHGWQESFPDHSAPYFSIIVFLVRKGNPKEIFQWEDLVKDDVKVITPNPKTSGGARWNYLGAWAYANDAFQGDETLMRDYMKRLFQHVLVLDSGARGSAATFAENGQGDVLLAWENEAFLLSEKYPDQYEIIVPSVSVRAEPVVAVVDDVAEEHGTREVASAYLSYLYSEEAQRLAAQFYYRPSNASILKEYSTYFNEDIRLAEIRDELFGGWENVQAIHFADGGIFDQVYIGD